MKTLIPLNQYIVKLWNTYLIYDQKEAEKFACSAYEYTNFLDQPLKLWMFIPCDKEGNPIENPKDSNRDFFKDTAYKYELRQYQEAKDKVLFEGFETTGVCENYVIIESKEYVFTWSLFRGEFMTIKGDRVNDLIKYNLKLTQTAQTQIQG